MAEEEITKLIKNFTLNVNEPKNDDSNEIPNQRRTCGMYNKNNGSDTYNKNIAHKTTDKKYHNPTKKYYKRKPYKPRKSHNKPKKSVNIVETKLESKDDETKSDDISPIKVNNNKLSIIITDDFFDIPKGYFIRPWFSDIYINQINKWKYTNHHKTTLNEFGKGIKTAAHVAILYHDKHTNKLQGISVYTHIIISLLNLTDK